jgi:ankyrin repeat protein
MGSVTSLLSFKEKAPDKESVMFHSRKRLLITFLLLALFVLLPAWAIWRAAWQERMDQALLTAVYHDAPEEIRTLLHEEADPNVRVTTAPPRTWRQLLQHWLHPSSPALTDTALMLAARQGRLIDVQQLLAAGSQVNAANGMGETALTVALEKERADVMQALLVRGANPNVQVKDFNNSAVSVLIQTLRTFNRDNFGETTCRDVVRMLLDRGANIHAVDRNGATALLTAIQEQEPEIAQWLIAAGADINRANKYGDTPLHVSTYDYDQKSPGVLDTLLQRNVDITPARNGGWNLLCWAAEQGNAVVMQTALRRGLGVDSRDKYGRTPLMYAAANGEGRVLKMLLDRGADIDACDKMGWTALMFASQGDNLPVIRILLDHGVDRLMRDHENHWTAERRARKLGQERFVGLLKNGRVAPGHQVDEVEDAWLGGERREETAPARRVQVDAHRWIDIVHLPSGLQSEYHEQYAVEVVDDRGRRGEPFGADTFFFQPEVQLFWDTDGRLYAFLRGHHRSEANYVVAIRGRTLVRQCELGADYTPSCQLLPGGGVLIAQFQSYRNMTNIPSSHKDDEVAEVSRFRSGVLTDLGLLFLPEQ